MRAPESPGRLTPWSTWALIGALIALVGALALCIDRGHNGDFYMSLLGGRFIGAHGFVSHDPFPTIAQGGSWLNQQWLSELAFFRVEGSFGQTGLTIVYAALLAAPLALLLWLCRHKGATMLIAITVVYFPGVLAIIHPRAAGFTVLAFSLLVSVIAVAVRPLICVVFSVPIDVEVRTPTSALLRPVSCVAVRPCSCVVLNSWMFVDPRAATCVAARAFS